MLIRTTILTTLCVQVFHAAPCFVDEQTSQVRVAISVKHGESDLHCRNFCADEPRCVSMVYSETSKLCVLQSEGPAPLPGCGTIPYRRMVKTNAGCVGTSLYTEMLTDPLAALGHDECIADLSLIRADLLAIDPTPPKPVCPLRQLDGSQGPVMYVRTVANTGTRWSYGIAQEARVIFNSTYNSWVLRSTDQVAYPYGWWASAITCVERGSDDCLCEPLKLHPSYLGGTVVPPDTTPACPGRTLYAQRNLVNRNYSLLNIQLNGDTARLLCLGGSWMVGDVDPGYTVTIASASCA